MKCCKCNKEVDVDVDKHEVPAKWYGMYTASQLIKIICSECIKKPENKGDWAK